MRKSKKPMIALIIVVLLLAAVLGGGAIYYTGATGAVDKTDNTQIMVNVPQGSSAYGIINILKEQGLIKDVTAAKLFLKLNNYGTLQANTYILDKTMDLNTIFKIINTGDFRYISKEKITVIEGATIPEVAQVVAKALKITKEEVLAKWADKAYLKELMGKYWFLTDDILQEGIMFPLEGYLYPETYFVTGEKPTIEDVTKQLLDKMDKELTAVKPDIEATGMSVHQFLSLASVVQAEAYFPKDRPIIAGVFMNRLKVDMPLQSCITALYAIQEKRVNVTLADTRVDSPYNTYKYSGLPIGPVCTVPSVTMSDVIHYTKSDYIYFFAKKDREVIYSVTLQEHEKAIKDNLWY